MAATLRPAETSRWNPCARVLDTTMSRRQEPHQLASWWSTHRRARLKPRTNKLQLEDMRQQQERAQEQLDDIVARISIMPPLATGTLAAAPLTAQVMSNSSLPPASTHLTEHAPPAAQVAEQFWTPPKPKATKSRVKEITLGNGITITFTLEDIPDLKAISFARQLSRLNCIWDDTSEYWNRDSPLQIKEQPIAMIYWPAVFTYTKPKVWSEIKQDYSDWKVSGGCHC